MRTQRMNSWQRFIHMISIPEKFHNIMTKYVVEESGDFRHGEEGVFNGEQCIFMAPPARLVPQLINELFSWMKESHGSVHSIDFEQRVSL